MRAFLLMSIGYQLCSAQNVTVPTLRPAVANAGTPTTVIISALVTSRGAAVIQGSVNAIQVDVNGKTIKILGSLNDLASGGDAIAGDNIYSGHITINQPVESTLYFRVSAALMGTLQRPQSPPVKLRVVPPDFPATSLPLNVTKLLTDGPGTTPIVCDELLVAFKGGTVSSAVKTAASSVGGKVVGYVAALDIVQINISTCSIEALRAAATALERLPEVVSVNFNRAGQLDAALSVGVIPSDPYFSSQWSLERIKAPTAWATVRRGVAIGIIDTGVAYDHEDLAGRVMLGLDQCEKTVEKPEGIICEADVDPADNHGHGTGTASNAAAIANNAKGMAGAAYEAPIIAEKISALIHGKPVFTELNVALAIVDAVSLGARVVNLSLGAAGIVKSAVDYALARHTVVVAAAGNSSAAEPVYPAAYPGVISVGASDEENKRARWNPLVGGNCLDSDEVTLASNYGQWVDIYAPGKNLVYAKKNGGYDVLCAVGTSWAAPIVSATASLMLAVNGSLTPAEVKSIIKQAATLTGQVDDPSTGNQLLLLDMDAAVREASALIGTTIVAANDINDGTFWESWRGGVFYSGAASPFLGKKGILSSIEVKVARHPGNGYGPGCGKSACGIDMVLTIICRNSAGVLRTLTSSLIMDAYKIVVDTTPKSLRFNFDASAPSACNFSSGDQLHQFQDPDGRWTLLGSGFDAYPFGYTVGPSGDVVFAIFARQ
ncbi:MAG: S8 family serine peptidase [Bryobacteraceae bacterium]|nr:S8 family serine peptidase [Bryobacteraceae bacterium]